MGKVVERYTVEFTEWQLGQRGTLPEIEALKITAASLVMRWVTHVRDSFS